MEETGVEVVLLLMVRIMMVANNNQRLWITKRCNLRPRVGSDDHSRTAAGVSQMAAGSGLFIKKSFAIAVIFC